MNFRRKSIFAYLLILIFMFNGNITKARNFLNPPDDKYLAFAEVMPAPIGGIGAITKTIKYPTIAKQSGIEGKVYVLIDQNSASASEIIAGALQDNDKGIIVVFFSGSIGTRIIVNVEC